MKLEFVHYPKIGQFRNVCNILKKDMSKITFKGTVKLHGTNAALNYHPKEGFKVQSRSTFVGAGHFGFYDYTQRNHEQLNTLLNDIYNDHCKEEEQLVVFGEWAGKGIQKNIAISQLDKSFYIFDIAIYNKKEVTLKFLEPVDYEKYKKTFISNLYWITDFQSLELTIDFSNPQLVQNTLADLTLKVEEECPVSKELGIKGVGEGIVWKAHHQNQYLMFKVKGEKHSSSKVKTLAKVSTEKLESINSVVEYVCTENRMEQAIKETGATTSEDIRKLLKWLSSDIIKEESDTIKDNGLKFQDIIPFVNKKMVKYFQNNI